jgi:hypothetical protein
MAPFIERISQISLFVGLSKFKGDWGMMRYDNEKELESRLRKIVLNSADVSPEIVSAYLNEVAENGYSEVKEEVLKEYLPLIDHIPTNFVDFACRVFIADIEKYQLERSKYASQMIGDNFDLDIYDGIYKLGIAYDMEFFPPSHLQGPFIYLLKKNEDEGLRLIQMLTNTAILRWKEFQQGRYRRLLGENKTPLSTFVDLHSGLHEYWGDEQVYQWYRPQSNGPNVVRSGLMALEVWMEEQIEKDRNCDELFNKILAGSNCVAVLGICLGIAMEYPKKCLRAAMPLILSPTIWRMDIARYSSDLSPVSGSSIFDLLGLHKHIYDAQDERNKRPQRSRDIRSFALLYMLCEDSLVRTKFERAVSQFAKELPFLFEEEKNDSELVESLCKNMELYQLYGNGDNYRVARVDDHIQIWFEPPEPLRKNNEEELKPIIESQRLISLEFWAEKSIELGSAAEGMSLEEAVAAVKEIQEPKDFSVPYDYSDFPNILRLQAISGVAAAVLIIDYQKAEDLGLIDWCKSILLSAACMIYNGVYYKETIIPHNPKVSAGRGLCTIVAHCREVDKNIGLHILSLVCDPYVETIKAVFTGLRDVWIIDEALCWNALSLGLSLCLSPKELVLERSDDKDRIEYERVQHLFYKYIKNYEESIIPKLPRIPSEEDKLIFDYNLATHILSSLPLSDLVQNPRNKDQLLILIDGLISWIIGKNLRTQDDQSNTQEITIFENYDIMYLVSKFTKEISFEETRVHVLNPIKKTWPKVPSLTEDLLGGYINFHIAFIEEPPEKSLASWREICNWVLDSPFIEKIKNSNYIDQDLTKVLSKIIFVGLGKSLIDDKWQHATLFYDIFDSWVNKVGCNPNIYTYLIIILNGPGRSFSTNIKLQWLYHCVTNCPNIQDFWKSQRNGERTSSLLQKMWRERESQIRNNAGDLKIYSYLIDSLVASGVSSAAILQRKLEAK